jgi:hypothetical protein
MLSRMTPLSDSRSKRGGTRRTSPRLIVAARDRTTIRELLAEHDVALDGAYRILKGAFPRGERVDRHEWVASLREKVSRVHSDLAWHLFVAERGGKVIGLASGTYVGSVNVAVIGYIAIEPGIRARGLGTRLRSQLRRAFEADAVRITGGPLSAIVGEVGEGNPWLRRLARNPKVLCLDFAYYQPRLRDADEPSRFVFYYESMRRPRRRIAVTELRRLLFAVWRRVYRIPRPMERPAFRAMLRSLEGRRSVGSRHLPPARRNA